MKKEIEDYYRRSFNQIVKGPFLRPFDYVDDYSLLNRSIQDGFENQYEAIRKAILDFESKYSDITLRMDAKYFILVNFDKVVYRPLEKVSFKDQLLKDLYNDIRFVLGEVIESKFQVSKGGITEIYPKEISGHDIAKTGIEVWNKLKTMSKDSW